MASSLLNPSVPAASGHVAKKSLRNMKRKKNKTNSTSSDSQEDDDGASDSNIVTTKHWPRFWIIASKHGSPDVTTVSSFVIDKLLQGSMGSAKTIKKLRY